MVSKLRGKRPEAIEKRLKMLLYGGAGVGKTTASIQFPKPYLIDTERGAENQQYVKLLEKSGGAYFFTTDFDELVNEITSLMTEKHDYQTVIIDPLTVLYNDLLDKSAKSLATKEDPEGMAFGRHKAKADRRIKHLLNLLLRLDMNVIITSHAKKVWGPGMVDLGQTFDCYAKLDYLFDLVLEIQKRGTSRVGVVRKTRVESFSELESFDFSYKVIAEKYGAAILERNAEVMVLASKDQIAEVERLVELLNIPAETVDKWLDKALASSFSEMEKDKVQACIDLLNKKITSKETK